MSCLSKQPDLVNPVYLKVKPVDQKELKEAADSFSKALHKASFREESRPAIIGAFITALWYEKQDPQRAFKTTPDQIVVRIKNYCERAFLAAGKQEMGATLVQELDKLGKLSDEQKTAVTEEQRAEATEGQAAAVAIYTRLKELCPDQIDADFIGLLYQNFFTYTGAPPCRTAPPHSRSLSPSGANTLGQYFTPHWLVRRAPARCSQRLPDGQPRSAPPDRLHGARGGGQD